MKNNNVLLLNIDQVHTTEMGINRIINNLELDGKDIVKWSKTKIMDTNSSFNKKGINWYVSFDDYIVTINSHNYTIITAHKLKNL